MRRAGSPLIASGKNEIAAPFLGVNEFRFPANQYAPHRPPHFRVAPTDDP